ncbi:MAG: hypothetical protein HXY18_17345 [Bryobacteraceae bacterium]|nr:hypothetical protein [Bryobacteraceae bacterium]
MRFFQILCALIGASAIAAPARGPLTQLPSWFEPEGRTGGYVLRNAEAPLAADAGGVRWTLGSKTVRLALGGNEARWRWTPTATLPGVSNYIRGRERAAWRHGVPQFGRLEAHEVLPGADFHLYASGRLLEYDFVLAPGARPEAIGLRFEGADEVSLDSQGNLLVNAGGAAVLQRAPVAWQEVEGGRKVAVAARWRLQQGTASFEIGDYDRALPLVIDPVVTFSGYLGGSLIDRISAVASAGDGGFWLTGSIRSEVAPVEGTEPFQAEKQGESDVFVAKVMPDGGAWKLTYFSYIGGTGDEAGEAIVVKDGFLYLAGQTNSSNWPLGGEAFQTTLKGNYDAFVLKYDPRSPGIEAIFYSSYFGGSENEYATAVAVDAQDRIAVAGFTTSASLERVVPGTDLQPANRGGVDGFYFECVTTAPAGEALISGSFFGGDSTDIITAAVFDSGGYLYLTGVSHSSDLPLFGAGYYSEHQGGGDFFVAKVDPRLRGFDALLLGTYVGGSNLDVATTMKIDEQGLLWIAGYTLSYNLPVTGPAVQPLSGGKADGFLACVDPAKGGAEFLPYLTYFGATQDDVIYDLALAPGGRKIVAGYTYSRDFPRKDDPSAPPEGIRQSDIFVAQLDPSKSGFSEGVVYSVLFGGPGQDAAFGLALASDGTPFAAGTSSSPGLETEGTPAKPNGPGYTTGLFVQFGPALP